MFYNKLDAYLKEFEADEEVNDFWYDIGTVTAANIISEFSKKDWDEVLLNLPQKSLGWKKRFAYCLDNSDSAEEFSLLVLMLDTDDEELFEICSDSIREFVNIKNIQKLFSNVVIIDKIKTMIPHCTSLSLLVLSDLISSINKCISTNTIILDNISKDLNELNNLIEKRKLYLNP